MDEEMQARFDLLDINDKKDVACMISSLASHIFKRIRRLDRTEKEVIGSMSETALEFWCDYLDSLYNDVGN